MSDFEKMQILLEDAMEMLENPDLLPPSISLEMTDAVTTILSGWIQQSINTDEEGEPRFSGEQLALIAQYTVMATGCAYLVGKLEGMSEEQDDGGKTISYDIEPTHPEGQHVTINFNFR